MGREDLVRVYVHLFSQERCMLCVCVCVCERTLFAMLSLLMNYREKPMEALLSEFIAGAKCEYRLISLLPSSLYSCRGAWRATARAKGGCFQGEGTKAEAEVLGSGGGL